MDDIKVRFVDIKTFKELAADNAADNVAIRKFMTIGKMDELQRDDEKLQLKFSITTADVDRDNDSILVEGWDFTDYKKNPVVLWAHNYQTPPVAKAVNIFRDSASIDSTAEFTPKEMNPFGYMIYQMYKGGFLNAVSVGFQPTDYELARDRENGMNFTRQSLMEYSAVPVPSNPHALIQARSKGINTEPLKDWAENILDDWDSSGEGLLIPKNIIEVVRTDSDPKQKTSVQVPASTETTDELENDQKKADTETETRLENETETKSDTESETKAGTQPEIKRPISYAQAHPDGTPKAATDTQWNGSQEIAAATIDDLKIMSAWVDQDNEENKGAYKLPHHVAGGEHSLIWRGVTAAMGALLGARGGVDIPDADKRGVYNHLAKHYEDFDESPPEFRFVEAQTLKHLSDDYYFDFESGQLGKLTEQIKIDNEVNNFLKQLEEISKDAETDHVKSAMLEAINAFKDFKEGDCDCPEHSDDVPPDPDPADVVLELETETDGEEPEDFDPKAIAAIVAKQVDKAMRELTGKLD